MLTYSFENKGNDTIYEFLYKQIKNDILNQNLKSNEKLPSKRALSKNLGVSIISIENAYAQLMAEGYIYSKPKSGFYVSEFSTLESYIWNKNKFGINSAISNQSLSNSGNNNSMPSQTQPEVIADFFSKSTSADNFPFSSWTKLLRETMTENQERLMSKSPSCGILELRQAIADYLYEFRGMNINPEQIIIGAGTEYLYGLLIQLLGDDKTYAIEDPGYKKIAKIYDAHHINYKYISMDSQGVDMNILNESNADVLHISPSHHFPTGIVTSISRRMQLLGWANESENRYIIEDDYDSEFRMTGRPVPTLMSVDNSDKVIYVNTFSKSLSQTIRISYMILPESLMIKYNNQLNFYSCTVSNFEQYTLAKFIQRGYFEKHINRMRNLYRNTRNELLKCIRKYSTGEINITEEHAGLHFLLTADTKLSDTELIEKAREKGLIISCLSNFYKNPEIAPKHILLINYSGLCDTDLDRAVSELFNCF